MNIRLSKLFAVFALMLPLAIFAQQQTVFVKTKGGIVNKNVCGIEFINGTSVYISIPSIASISKQNYIAGPLEVAEISIDTTGSSQIRIYCATPIDAQKHAESLSNRLPQDLKAHAQPALQTVVEKANAAKGKIPFAQDAEKSAAAANVYKIYPSTTHSKTLEFAVASKDALDSLYKLLTDAFASANNETLSQSVFSEK
ncbi:MAG: hypothetical protein IKS15_00745 [Opitutales bacterium]|nr:hypothetical protein [Opitutales bacterium]